MKFLFLTIALFTQITWSATIQNTVPDLPPNACFKNCTPFMKNLLNEFEAEGVVPSQEPAVYSGECHHLGGYDSATTHYSVVLLDQKMARWNFSTIFTFFATSNEFAHWTLDQARQEMSSYWNDHGDIYVASNAAHARADYENGDAAYIYWMRQNPVTKDLLYITYVGTSTISFCRLKPHAL